MDLMITNVYGGTIYLKNKNWSTISSHCVTFFFIISSFFFFKNCLLDKLIDEFTVLNKTFGEQLKVANKEYFKNDSLVLMRSLKSSF